MSTHSDSNHPLFQRVSHWINLVNFFVLIVTGFLIHSPFQGMPMNFVRHLHFFFMFFLLINGVVRFYFSFFGENKDYDSFFLDKRDIQTIWPQIKYYLFMGEHPETGKYNPLQKMAYIALPIMSVVQAITGFILYRPEQFSTVAGYFGGLASVRGFHYLFTWLFIAIIAIHAYLVFTAAFDQFLLMFFGKERKEKITS